MSLQEETHRLGDERDRLDAELDDYADKLADADAGTASAKALRSTANEIESQLGGVEYLIDQHGADATVTVAGLDAGMHARVQDRAAAMRAQRDQPGDIPGARMNVFAAMGLVDAPFLEDDTDEGDPLDARLEALSGQPVGVMKWVQSLVNDLTTVSEGNSKSLAERLADKSAD